MAEIFPVLILNARPAAGKSEIIHALEQMPATDRARRFHIGEMHILDDFPILWNWFEEDQLLEQVFHRPRMYTTQDNYFLHDDLWHLLIRRLALDYEKWARDAGPGHTAIIEFSRSSLHGGYRAAYPHLGATILRQAAIFYVQVSFEESLRKNRARFNPERPDSILEHGLPDAKLERLYRNDDWQALTGGGAGYVEIDGLDVPYMTFENEDDYTTPGGEPLLALLDTAFQTLWELFTARRTV